MKQAFESEKEKLIGTIERLSARLKENKKDRTKEAKQLQESIDTLMLDLQLKNKEMEEDRAKMDQLKGQERDSRTKNENIVARMEALKKEMDEVKKSYKLELKKEQRKFKELERELDNSKRQRQIISEKLSMSYEDAVSARKDRFLMSSEMIIDTDKAQKKVENPPLKVNASTMVNFDDDAAIHDDGSEYFKAELSNLRVQLEDARRSHSRSKTAIEELKTALEAKTEEYDGVKRLNIEYSEKMDSLVNEKDMNWQELLDAQMKASSLIEVFTDIVNDVPGA